jgi:hypothetical protein
MTRTAAAAAYRTIRRAYITEQSARCTKYGVSSDVDMFDAEARCYLKNVEGVNAPTPADYVAAAQSMLAHLRAA